MEDILARMSEIEDKRHPSYAKYPLADILFFIVPCAVLCGLDISGGVIAMDGKAIRSTAKPSKPHSALQIRSAYVTGSGVILAQEAIHEKTNRIPVFQEIVNCLDVEGKTVTADATHC